MGFYADLHIHSKYSRATSRDCDLEHLSLWARKKGVALIATGDFTHPAWFAELEEKLVSAEPGLFRLRPDLEREVAQWLGESAAAVSEPTRFMLEVEISTIYKKDEKTRKVHHLIYAPDIEKARSISQALGRIGNISSDGRPILGLDSRDLLEIALEGGEGCYLVPAHIWTPWFAVLGSKSGFDTIQHCYGDLSSEIFAVETGLSSDPAMNRTLSMLDRYTLVSNSDAHSPPKIGREACVFETELDYFAIKRALETGERYGGTVEFFAEEGKYHLDGHRKCGVCLSPEETRSNGGVCPVCGQKVTLGVVHRVTELADREEPFERDDEAPYRSFVPLDEVISEIEQVGPKSKRVQREYENVVSRLGSELFVLEDAPVEDIARHGSGFLAEAISRMRGGHVIREPGFDGQYGKIHLFEKRELERKGGVLLFDFFEGLADEPEPESRTEFEFEPESEPESEPDSRADSGPEPDSDFGLDPDQRAAASIFSGPLAIIAGPGTGKTRTLTRRLAHLVLDYAVPPESCLAITFTRRAAREMAERLEALLPSVASRIAVTTFHAFGLSILRAHGERLGLPAELRVAGDAEQREIARGLDGSRSDTKAKQLLERFSRARRGALELDEDDTRDLATYTRVLREHGLVDFDELVTLPVELLDARPDVVAEYRERFAHVSVDEFQDIDPAQYRLLEHVARPGGSLCVIGDPDQSIYGFRGADATVFRRFERDFEGARVVQLTRNYRSSRTIVEAAVQMIAVSSEVEDRTLIAELPGPERIEIHECRGERAEAELVVHTIEKLIGGSTFFSFDSGRVDSRGGGGRRDDGLTFRDIAVLYRAESIAEPLVEALRRSGMPFQRRSTTMLDAVECVRRVVGMMRESVEDVDVAAKLEAALRVVREDVPELDHYGAALRELAERHGADLEGFQSELALGVDVDCLDPRAEAVSLLTLHAAKGLEFPVVFVIGCEDGVLPLHFGSSSSDSDADAAEERRLFFVGMTRARERLVLTHAKKRAWRGPAREMMRSPFVDAIEERLLAVERHKARRKKPAAEFEQLTLFDEL